MKNHLFKVFNTAFILTFLFSTFINAQSYSVSGGADNSKTAQTTQAEAQVKQVTVKSGVYFKEALLSLKDDRREEARVKFDKSVEEFLYSTIDVQRNQTLRECYSQLIETIYLMEFPSNQQPPNIRTLSATCGWDIKNDLADDIAKLVVTSPGKSIDGNGLIASANDQQPANNKIGFTEQEFEPSPLDDLAKLELTPEEQQVEDNPTAQQQFQYIKVAVENKSLGFSFQVHPMIQQFINYYQGRGRKTMEVGLYRSGMFMRMARKVFREEGVPENVAWLGQVESAWKPSALSWAAASGLWQFIPGTGSRFGLERTAYIDERNGFEKATQASARYLKFLANRYGGNWELAMAAYNSGEGNVDKAIRRAGVSSFWLAYQYLPQETRNYVPNILATILIANNPTQYGFGHIRPAAPLNYDQIRVPASTSLNLLAQASDTSVEFLRYLNPELRTNMSPPTPYIIRVPAGKANEVVAVFRKIRGAPSNSTLANSVQGETWDSLARRFSVSVADLMAANPGMRVPSGKVMLPSASGNNIRTTSYSRPTTPQSNAPAPNVRVVKAQAGDTVAMVAARNNVNPVELAKFNGLLPTSKLNAGREIRIPNK